ncbi:serine protease [Dinoroseobacter sp. PD6]|uniref:serine protease n=1 Tax=Dinoroseobacter sp. PD6 TaxID=3028384 RepID=UPI00237C07BF|nr:serine protease [Dinoroseobacter sp. PD6]MDD9716344.1 serine protease [Dinoroseobacter sp. PD6]
MTGRIFAGAATAIWLMAGVAGAQEQVWIQVEAQPTLRAAEDRARDYAGALGDVAGFRLPSGWYAIALGPFSPGDAAAVLSRLRSFGQVPGDSFIADGTDYGAAFWPQGQVTPPATAPGLVPDAPVLTISPIPEAPDETEAEARASERALDRPAREALQQAMQWFGFYRAAIDGAFGPGTRRAMSEWQADRGLPVTGTLTTAQRAQLLAEWQGDLAALGMTRVAREDAGIALDMPMGMVAFDRIEPPFVHYTGDGGRKALLISQEGSPAGLAGLYEIMQTLEVIPREGERALSGDSFEIRGRNDEIESYTYSALEDGLIKGFTLVWPPEDARLMARAAQMMRASFEPVGDSALDPTLGDRQAEQRIDLLAGLEVRQPIRAGSGFFVTPAGDVLTAARGLEGCARLTIGDDIAAELTQSDPDLGLALLSPTETVAPMAVARFAPGPARLQAEIAVAGYSYGGLLGAPTLSFGTLADLRGLTGGDALDRLAVTVTEADAGGPVLDVAGGVLGLLLPRGMDGGRVLPEDVNFSADAAAITDWLGAAGVEVVQSDPNAALPPERLAMLAENLTVLVSCWAE